MKNKNTSQRVITQHRSFYWPTIDDWYPNFIRSTVLVLVSDSTTGNNVHIRMSVWGADDFSLTKIFNVDISEKEKTLKQILKFVDDLPNPITQDWCYSNGFIMD